MHNSTTEMTYNVHGVSAIHIHSLEGVAEQVQEELVCQRWLLLRRVAVAAAGDERAPVAEQPRTRAALPELVAGAEQRGELARGEPHHRDVVLQHGHTLVIPAPAAAQVHTDTCPKHYIILGSSHCQAAVSSSSACSAVSSTRPPQKGRLTCADI